MRRDTSWHDRFGGRRDRRTPALEANFWDETPRDLDAVVVALQLAETCPARYDGALAACGPAGGSLAQIGYVADVELTFRYVYPGVPAWHENAHAARVATAGRADELLTVIVPLEGVPTGIDPFGHCGFAPEVVAAFAELAVWVETGVRPTRTPPSPLLRAAADHADDRRQQGPTGTSPDHVGNDRSDVEASGAARDAEQTQELATAEAAERPGDRVAGPAQGLALHARSREGAADRAGDELDDDREPGFHGSTLPAAATRTAATDDRASTVSAHSTGPVDPPRLGASARAWRLGGRRTCMRRRNVSRVHGRARRIGPTRNASRHGRRRKRRRRTPTVRARCANRR